MSLSITFFFLPTIHKTSVFPAYCLSSPLSSGHIPSPQSDCDWRCSPAYTEKPMLSQHSGHPAISPLWALRFICHHWGSSFWDVLVSGFLPFWVSLPLSPALCGFCFLLGHLSSICHLNVDVPQGFGCASSCLVSPAPDCFLNSRLPVASVSSTTPFNNYFYFLTKLARVGCCC